MGSRFASPTWSVPGRRTGWRSTMRAESGPTGGDAKNVVVAWEDAHRYSPAPRHRRRLLRRWIDRLDFASVLDAGCAQPFLLREILAHRDVEGFGCDLSDQV